METSLQILDQSIIDSKIDRIRQLLQGKNVLVAFSGGVDSTVVAYLAREYAQATKLVMQIGYSVAIGERAQAQKQADSLGLPLEFLEYDEVDYSESYVENTENRCYFCKQLLFDFIEKKRILNEYDLILSGTNYSDLGGHRPGHKAAQEAGVLDPLAIVGITKPEVRWIAHEAGLAVWDKPASACLASRFMTGVRITKEELSMVAEAEYYLKSTFDIRVLRVRHHGNLARIEVGQDELSTLLDEEKFSQIVTKLTEIGYEYITLDMNGYRPNVPPSYNQND